MTLQGTISVLGLDMKALTIFRTSLIYRWYILNSSRNNQTTLYEGVTTGDLIPCEIRTVFELQLSSSFN